MPECNKCDGCITNKSDHRVRISRGMLEPRSSYCNDCKKIRKITAFGNGNYGYPVWCPRNMYKGTCIECGTRIREEEGEYCRSCKRKR